jgi:hypothetical protein
MDKKTTVLKYLEDILFFNGIQDVLNTFLGNAELISNGYDYLKEYDYYLKDEMIIDAEDDSVFQITIVNRDDFFKRYLKTNKQDVYNYLEYNMGDQNFSDILIKVYDDLNTYINKSETTKAKFNEIITPHLISLVEDFKIKFPIVQIHKVFKHLNDSSGFISFFQYKDLKTSFFEDLYEVTYKLNLIDDVDVVEETFYDILTSSKPNPQQKIFFIKKNHLIAYYLKEIEPFFNNLNPVTIEQSKCFFNKQGKQLTSTDLYTSLSRNKDKDLDLLKKIKLKLDELKKTHLK